MVWLLAFWWSALPVTAPATPDVTSIAAGAKFSCAALTDGTVRCWGYNADGELGDGTHDSHATPVRVIDLDDAVDVTATDRTACARRRDGSVSCWGVIGHTPIAKPTQMPITDVVQVSGTCMRTREGAAWCLSAQGQVVRVADLNDAIDVAGSGEIGCAVRATGAVACWFDNDHLARVVTGMRGMSHVAVESSTACALAKRDGSATCWQWLMEDSRPIPDPASMRGMTMAPRLRTVPINPRLAPLDAKHVANVSGATMIAGAFMRTCAAEPRAVRCWASYGDASRVAIDHVTQLAVGETHACVLRGGRDVRCWGEDLDGELGNGWAGARTVATSVPGISDVVAIETSFTTYAAAGPWTCAQKRDGHAWCWGLVNDGPHGAAPQEVKALGTPTRFVRGAITAVIDAKSRMVWSNGYVLKTPPLVAASDECGLGTDGHVYCPRSYREDNDDGQKPLAGLDDIVQLAVAKLACARRKDGQVICFKPTRRDTIAAVPDAIDLSSGGSAACAVRADHHVWCWGTRGSWVLEHATGKTKYEAVPAGEIGELSDVTSIGVGEDHACALRSDRTVWCWGDNALGELGDGTQTARRTPAKVQGLERVAALSVGSHHACALLDDGTVSCWGQARYGEVGTYATDDVTTPSAVLW